MVLAENFPESPEALRSLGARRATTTVKGLEATQTQRATLPTAPAHAGSGDALGTAINCFKSGRERTPHSAEMYGIYRVAASRRWVVMIRRQGAVLRKTFGFGPYGGEQPALEHAKLWRDDAVRNHPPTQKKMLAMRPRSHNTSGFAGVFCVFNALGKPIAWNAKTVLGPGRVLSKNFNIKALGNAQAKQLAIVERQKQLEMMEGFPPVHSGESQIRTSHSREADTNLPVPLMPGEELRCSSSTGIPGVFLLRFPSGEPMAWKAATLCGDQVIGRAYFSVQKYGYDKAKALAIAARQEQLKQKMAVRAAQAAQKLAVKDDRCT